MDNIIIKPEAEIQIVYLIQKSTYHGSQKKAIEKYAKSEKGIATQKRIYERAKEKKRILREEIKLSSMP